MKADPREPDDLVNLTPTHWLREATIMTVGLAVVAVGVFTTIALLANLLAPLTPPRIEAEVTEAIWAEVQEYVPEWDEDVVARLDTLVGQLANHWPDREYDFHVAVVEAVKGRTQFPQEFKKNARPILGIGHVISPFPRAQCCARSEGVCTATAHRVPVGHAKAEMLLHGFALDLFGGVVVLEGERVLGRRTFILDLFYVRILK